MPLDKMLFPVALGQGIDTKTDPKRVLAGKLLNLQNGVLTQAGQIAKRNGYDALSTMILQAQSLGTDVSGVLTNPLSGVIELGQNITSATNIGFYKSEMLEFSDQHVYSWSDTIRLWNYKSDIYSVDLTSTQVIRNSYQQSVPDLSINSNIACFVYEDSSTNGVNVTAMSPDTGTVYQYNVQCNSAARSPRTVIIGNVIYIFYYVGANLYLRMINALLPNQLGAEHVLFNDFDSSQPYFDIAATGNYIFIAYATTSGIGGHNITCAYVTTLGTVGTVFNGFANPVIITLQPNTHLNVVIEPVNQINIIAYSNNSIALNYFALNFDLSPAQGSTVIYGAKPALQCALYVINPTQFGIVWELSTGSGHNYDNFVMQQTLSIIGAGGTGKIILRSVGIASKAFTDGINWFVNVCHDSTLQSTYFMMRVDGQVFAKMQPTEAGGLPAKTGQTPFVTVIGKKAYWPAQIKTKVVTQNNTTFSLKGLSLETIDFNGVLQFPSQEMSENLVIGGGIIMGYDSTIPIELGFNYYPENFTATPLGSGGSMNAGNVQYFIIYEWTDTRGQVHRSSPSIPVTKPVVNSDSVSLVIPTLRITNKNPALGVAGCFISIFRTAANGIIPYRITNIPQYGGALANPLYNDLTVDTVTYLDQASDASISSNEILYTSGGILENDPPPAGLLIDVNKNRALIGGLENGLEFAFSKLIQAGEVVSFNDNFRFQVDPLGGDITAIKWLDDKIIYFKRNLIYFISGDGPDDLGRNNDFTKPSLISSDVGCPYPVTCVLTPLGLIFKSLKGLYLLDRSLSVRYIGAEVEAYNSYTITSATMISDKNQVRFITNNDICIVYDYFFSQWYIFTNHGGVGAGIWQQNSYAYARSNGQVYVENSTKYLDDSTSYSLTVLTGWLKLSTLQGYQRIRSALILGNYLSSHQLQVQVAYDYQSFFTDQYIFNSSAILAASVYGQDGVVYGGDPVYGGLTTSDGVLQFQMKLSKQKCQAIQFQISDFSTSQLLDSLTITDLLLDCRVKAGPMRLPAVKKVGSS